ncbi:hypothetical protein HYR99_07010 [Candidatus Poribacteria bacterium]|nr:hypothetical protein [Candidatus Poribacteria bacterium]
MESKCLYSKDSVRNPYGRLGGLKHRAEVEKIIQEIIARELKAKTEHRVETPEGIKSCRFLDVVAIHPRTRRPVEFYQVGRQTKQGVPVSRERQAISDVEKATGITVQFRVYQ